MVGDEVVPCQDTIKWAEWHEKSNRHIGQDDREGIRISTVFLGIDHGFGWLDMTSQELADYKPVLWETMVFGGPLDQEQWRYDDLEKAKKGHELAVHLVELGNNWWTRWWFFHIKPFLIERIRPYMKWSN